MAMLRIGARAVALLAGLAVSAAWAEARVDVLELNGMVSPFMAQYLVRGIEEAEKDGAEAVVIRMDTPGGLMESMDQIVKKILDTRVPVVVYISPKGARAGSAGTFIAMAAQVVAMAPLTSIGAAHPVSGEGKDLGQDLRDKVTNDAAARVRSYAQARGRNAEWAEQSVRQSASLSAEQALEQKVVELVAGSVEEVLDRIDGRQVQVADGTRVLHTRGALVREVPMRWSEKFLQVITNPNIAYLLLSLGTVGLIAELYNPGAVFPGVTGLICLAMAFAGLGVLQPNWVGVGLILMAVALFVIDLKVQGYALTVGGAVAFVLGSLLLFRPVTPHLPELPAMPQVSVSPWLIALMTVLWVGFFAFALRATVRAHRTRVTSGVDAVVGVVGLAQTDLDPRGIVLVHSEEWSAEAVGESIPKGGKVEVVAIVGGVQLQVRKAPPR